MKHLFSIAFLLMLGALAGCAAQPLESKLMAEAQLIVKFKPHVTAPADSGYIARLSRDIGAPLTYVRVMAGAAHIFKIGYANDADLTAAVAKFNRHTDVEYAELDRMMRIN